MARIAIVTGGTRGIGEAISVALRDMGLQVAANYAGISNQKMIMIVMALAGAPDLVGQVGVAPQQGVGRQLLPELQGGLRAVGSHGQPLNKRMILSKLVKLLRDHHDLIQQRQPLAIRPESAIRSSMR